MPDKEKNPVERWVDSADATYLMAGYQLCVALLQMTESIDCDQIQELIRQRLTVLTKRHYEALLLNALGATCPNSTFPTTTPTMKS